VRKPVVVFVTSLLFTLALSSGVWAGQEGRVSGQVQDEQGNPIQDVKVTFSAVGMDYQKEVTTNKKGKLTAILLDATLDFMVKVEHEGYVTIEEPFDAKLGEVVRPSWTLVAGSGSSGGAAAPSGSVAPTTADISGQAGRLYTDGIEAFQAGDPVKALEKFNKAAEMKPEVPEIHSAMALVYLETAAYDEALAASDRVLELKPGDPLALRVQFQTYQQLGDEEKEAALLEALKEFDPGPETARLIFNLGVEKVKAGNLEGAVADFLEAKGLDPELISAYSALARVYFDLGSYDESIDMAQQYLEKGSSAEVLGVLYLAYGKQGRSDEAEKIFADLKEADPAYVGTVLQQLGEAYFNAGQAGEAMPLFKRVLEANPDHPRAHYMLALCYVNAGDTAQAKQLLERFVELAPNDPEAGVAKEMLSTL
jgi:tetratricopeptide (TPR) repeat protein